MSACYKCGVHFVGGLINECLL